MIIEIAAILLIIVVYMVLSLGLVFSLVLLREGLSCRDESDLFVGTLLLLLVLSATLAFSHLLLGGFE